MFKKLSRKYCLEKYQQFPQSDHEKETYFYPKTYSNYVLTLPSNSLKGHATRKKCTTISCSIQGR